MPYLGSRTASTTDPPSSVSRTSSQVPRPVRAGRPSSIDATASRNAVDGQRSIPTSTPHDAPTGTPATDYSPAAFLRRLLVLRSGAGLPALAASTLAFSASIRSTTLDGSASSV